MNHFAYVYEIYFHGTEKGSIFNIPHISRDIINDFFELYILCRIDMCVTNISLLFART